MKILFVHQNFPGQYVHVIQRLAQHGRHQLLALGINSLGSGRRVPEKIKYFQYHLERGNTNGIHPLVMETETKIIRAEGCARAAEQLKQKGFAPDLICAHPGWGEPLFLKAIWPDSPLLCYQEFFYNEFGFDSNFDPEFQDDGSWQAQAKLTMKNAYLHLTLEHADWNVSPTHFQASSFPEHWRRKISVIHDGVDLQQARPNPSPAPLKLPDGTVLESGQPIVTFVNRCLEPYRGCHTFIRAIPELQRQHPEARIVVVGRTKGVSYGGACPDGEWGERFLAEIDGQYEPSRVHFTGPLPYRQFIPLLQISACHVYLTYPFVMSWSLLEAMGCGCAVVGSDTAPVREVIRHGQNGVLVNFFSPTDLAAAVVEMLNDPERAAAFGVAARETVERTYELNACVTRQLALMDLVASRSIVA
ncbi:glycosyltransferase family 4 protein [Synechococcus sp. RS9902]|uniref:glycosyltransferase family 4 protein n=1 Tax=Synechococcus sp. RS9902 TaxID=221345 RepID=UPI001647940F|nr:glycosyltransferase family 4 protein [Synechococcus sp. RS9902]QNI96110.1 glycosyl transferase/ family 4 [Synechococcus sp. RS9902]